MMPITQEQADAAVREYLARPNYRAVPRNGAWAVQRTGKRVRSLAVGLTRSAAWQEARRLARGAGGRAYLFGREGRIIARNDYGATE